jgi:uncharacterized protein YjbJ (UPF0337 family)
MGKLTGDTTREIGGKAQNIKGKAEEKIGDLKDSASNNGGGGERGSSTSSKRG